MGDQKHITKKSADVQRPSSKNQPANPQSSPEWEQTETRIPEKDRLSLDGGMTPPKAGVSASLNPKAILNLQRQIGNQAVQRLLAQNGHLPKRTAPKGVVQRNVGFEFEVGRYQVQQLNANMTPQQYTGATQLNPGDLGDGNLEKSKAMARGTGFEMQVDEGANDFHLEFVTSGVGFPETKAGRGDLKTAMEGMEALGKEVTAKTGTAGATLNLGGGTRRLVQTGEVTGGIPTKPETVISGAGQMEAEPQTTAGIRLDQIATLMENMAAPAGESQAEKRRRSPQRTTLAAKSNVQDTAAMREAPPAARTAIDNFKVQMTNAGVVLPGGFGSESLVGLMALIYTYLKKATLQVRDYPKSLFPLLGITDFASMFAMLPDDDQAPFTAVPQRFVDINLAAANMAGTGGTAFFAGGFANQLTNMTVLETQQAAAALGAITRQDWLSDIPQGTDRLTKAYTHVDALESMGKLNRGEEVGQEHTFSRDTNTDAPILELRRLAGHVGINNWKDLALDIFDFIVKLNDLKTREMEGRRYDITHPK
jgi:hypothetical protein